MINVYFVVNKQWLIKIFDQMTIICRYCKKANVSSASYCVNCGKVLNDANIKMVVPKKDLKNVLI